MGKKIFAFVLALCMLVSVMPTESRAAESSNIQWSIDDGTLEVTFRGDWTGDVPWLSRKDEITEAFIDGQGMTKLNGMFKGYTNLEKVYASGLNTDKVTDFSEMFSGCTSLTLVNMKRCDMASVESLKDMFNSCEALSTTNISDWVFGDKTVTIEGMFKNCKSIKNLDLSTWKKTGAITNINNAFSNCKNLETLNLSGFDLSGITTMKYAFRDDTKISTKLTISKPIVDTAHAFTNAATEPGSQIFIRYADIKLEDIVEAMRQAAADDGANVTVWKIPEITDKDVTLSKDEVIYDGKEQRPAVTVKVNDVKLKEGEDYTLTYYNNKDASSDKAYVRITGREDYRGTVDKHFAIVKESNKITVTSEKIQRTVSTKETTLKFTAKAKYGKLKCLSDSKKVTVKLDDKGHATVKIAANYIGKATITFESESAEKYKGEKKKVVINVGPSGTDITSVASSLAGQFLVKWKKNSTASGYQVRYDSDSKMKKPTTKTVGKNSTIKLNVKGLKDGNTYYVQVRTYKTVGKEKVYSGWSNTKAVKVAIVSINKTAATVYKGDSITLKINGSGGKVKWSSSNKSVATVSSKGKVTAQKKGKAVITAKVGKYTLKCTITVKNKTGYQQLYDYIILNGKSNKDGNLFIKNGNYAIIYNFTYKRFDFIYVKDGADVVEKDSMTMSIGRNGSKTATAVYAFSDGVNFCKSSATFTVDKYKASSSLSFSPSVYRGFDVSKFNKMANTTLRSSMSNWSKLVKKAGTSMKAIGFKAY